MNQLVCILTAGKGTRMGKYTSYLNKAILPIKGKAIISYIIEKFPKNTEFVIGLGHWGNQVKDYLEIAHSDIRFHFVTIKKYEGKGSGPGYSLLQCKDKLSNPFYFVSCDTLWSNELDFNVKNNWMGTAQVGSEETQSYCNFELSAGRIVAIKDKQRVNPLTHEAFVGLCYIKDTDIFFQGLENPSLKAGELQVSNGIQALIDSSSLVEARHIDWIDVGGEVNYKKEVSKYENYDFSKSNESLYIVNGRVIKFFADKSFAEKRVVKAALNPSVFPHIDKNKSNFFSYPFINGKTLYHSNTFPIFNALLSWLDKKLWKKVGDIDRKGFRAICKKFYYDKTLKRLETYYKKYTYTDVETTINGLRIPETRKLLKQVPWESIYDGIPSFMHGDLQFDNILYNQNNSFTLLDWRQDFGGVVEYGDMYYDLAKMRGGIILNYDLIKLNLLNYKEGSDGIYFDFAQRYLTDNYLQILDRFIQKKRLDVRKVQILVGLIYLNMSPLHHFPFDKMLYSLGRQVLFSVLQSDTWKK